MQFDRDLRAGLSGKHRADMAVMSADVAGYTRLMEIDEEGTHARFMHLRYDIIEPVISKYDGTAVKNTGDGFLAMFETAMQAMDAAVEMQRAILASEREISSDRKISFRMGVNVASVIIEADDIYGDGVNVAARLQSHAEPGGIVISGVVADQIGDKHKMISQDMGRILLKNRGNPVQVFSLRLPEASQAIIQQTGLNIDPRPSIAVLPFRSLTSDSGNYFADGIVDNIIHALGALQELFVISRASTLVYNRAQADSQTVGRALGVRYVLMGSIQRSGQNIEIRTELHDTSSNEIIRTETFDGDFGGIFELQKKIAEGIVKAIAPSLRSRELKRVLEKHPQNMNAYDLVLQALEYMERLDYSGFSEARGLLERAMELDPGYSMPFALAARWYSLRIGQAWSKNRKEDGVAALALAEKALSLDRQNTLALCTFGYLKSFLFRDYETGKTYIERAIKTCPSNHLAWGMSSISYSHTGNSKEAIARGNKALKLSPFDQSIYYYYTVMCLANYVAHDYDEAIHWGMMAMSENDRFTATLRYLAASYAAIGNLESAKNITCSLLNLEPKFKLLDYGQTRMPFSDEQQCKLHLAHLRKAGLH